MQKNHVTLPRVRFSEESDGSTPTVVQHTSLRHQLKLKCTVLDETTPLPLTLYRP